MASLNLYPYLSYSLKLKAISRRGGGNMFRHQVETLAILLEYGYTQPLQLKAALIHDLLEEAEAAGFSAVDEISTIDEDGVAVLALVREVSRRVVDGVEEPKSEFLERIMIQGSEPAKILKLADRISNISALPLATDSEFIRRYLTETEQYIMPYAGKVNQAMARELETLLQSIPKITDP